MREGDRLVLIPWHVNPFRGDAFEERWRPLAEAVLDYGATSWALVRAREEPLAFMQLATFSSEEDFERYWNSEEVSEARVELAGYFQVPLNPEWLRVVDAGVLTPAPVDAD
ncbi:MAG TPA: hypothetical protein VF520_01240 [Thermoleophilaceae bacterium]